MNGYAIGNYRYTAYAGIPKSDGLSALLAPALILGGIYLLYEIFGPGGEIALEDAPQYARDAARRRRF